MNPGYAAFQIAKALTTSQQHADPGARQQALAKIERWQTVLRNIVTGSVHYGSRTPVEGAPNWATLEVITGGFATGRLLAGGPLQDHEQKLREQYSLGDAGEDRRALNALYLTTEGLADLQQRLHSRRYDVQVPEEGALLVVAWLVEQQRAEEARALIDVILPHFGELRFYPVPLEQARTFGAHIHLQDVQATIGNIARIKPHPQVSAQKEAVEVWAPFYDRMIALFLETVVDDWPCRIYPTGWAERATQLLDEYKKLRRVHYCCGKPERAKGHFAQLRALLAKALQHVTALSGRDVGKIRLILRTYIQKRGLPNSEGCAASRQRQRQDVHSPLHREVAEVVLARLRQHAQAEGLDDVSHLQFPVDAAESQTFRLPAGCEVPESIQRKVERCLNLAIAELIERGIITSGDTLANVLPQMTSGIRAAGIADAALRDLYAAIYRAFRRRRSLLLLDLAKQVQIEELPWIAAIEPFRGAPLSSQELSRQALEEITVLTLTAFPHAILPNKLLQELRALAKSASIEMPLVEEIAADIFMGQFTPKFVTAAKLAGALLKDSLYARYFNIDYAAIECMSPPAAPQARSWTRPATLDSFAEYCSARTGVRERAWGTVANGMILEQAQIVTTQNLATLVTKLNLQDILRDQWSDMAMRCFQWICQRQQMKIDKSHARLIMVKNTAYAWRQMVCYLSLLSKPEVDSFLATANDYLQAQPEKFATRFQPALQGLISATNGYCLVDGSRDNELGRQFLGWTNKQHWLLPIN